MIPELPRHVAWTVVKHDVPYKNQKDVRMLGKELVWVSLVFPEKYKQLTDARFGRMFKKTVSLHLDCVEDLEEITPHLTSLINDIYRLIAQA